MEYLGAHYDTLKHDADLEYFVLFALHECGITIGPININEFWRRLYIGTIAAPSSLGRSMRTAASLKGSKHYEKFRNISHTFASPQWIDHVHLSHFVHGSERNRMKFIDAIVYAAAYHGNLAELQTFVSAPQYLHEHVLILAARRGHLNIVCWGVDCVNSMYYMSELLQILFPRTTFIVFGGLLLDITRANSASLQLWKKIIAKELIQRQLSY